MDVGYAINQMTAWVKRRRDRGEHPNADAIWERIRSKWPAIGSAEQSRAFGPKGPNAGVKVTEDDQERVFQGIRNG